MLVLWVAILTTFTVTHAEFTVPPNDAYVTDEVEVLTEEQELQLEEKLKLYAEATSNEIAILIVPTLNEEPEAETAVAILRKWGIGDSDKNNGVLILHNYNERRVFISVGYGLEGALPDLVIDGILQKDMTPSFREGNYFAGYSKIIDALIGHIGGEYTAERYTKSEFSYSGIFFFLFFFLEALISFLRRTKSWWQGGVIGAVVGIVLLFIEGWWLAIPVFIVLGLIIDYIVSTIGFMAGASTGGRTGYGYRSSTSRRRSGGFRGFGGGSGGAGGAGRSY